MSETIWLLLQKIHGHVALLGIALCFHPAVALRRVRRPSRWTVLTGMLATTLMTITTALGWWIYPAYRHLLKRDLYVANRFWGEAFEVKEHWAHYAWCFVVAGAVMLVLSARRTDPTMRNGAALCYALAGVIGLGVAVLGIGVSWVNGFADLVP